MPGQLKIISRKISGLKGGLREDNVHYKIMKAIREISMMLNDLSHALHDGDLDDEILLPLMKNYFGRDFDYEQCKQLVGDLRNRVHRTTFRVDNEQHAWSSIETLGPGHIQRDHISVLFSSTLIPAASEHEMTLACVTGWHQRPKRMNNGLIVMSLPALKRMRTTDPFTIDDNWYCGMGLDRLLGNISRIFLHELIHIYFDITDAVITEHDLSFPYENGIGHSWASDTRYHIMVYETYKAQALASSPTISHLARRNPDNVAYFIFLLYLGKQRPKFDFSGTCVKARQTQISHAESEASDDSGYYSESGEYESETDTDSDHYFDAKSDPSSEDCIL